MQRAAYKGGVARVPTQLVLYMSETGFTNSDGNILDE